MKKKAMFKRAAAATLAVCMAILPMQPVSGLGTAYGKADNLGVSEDGGTLKVRFSGRQIWNGAARALNSGQKPEVDLKAEYAVRYGLDGEEYARMFGEEDLYEIELPAAIADELSDTGLDLRAFVRRAPGENAAEDGFDPEAKEASGEFIVLSQTENFRLPVASAGNLARAEEGDNGDINDLYGDMKEELLDRKGGEKSEYYAMTGDEPVYFLLVNNKYEDEAFNVKVGGYTVVKNLKVNNGEKYISALQKVSKPAAAQKGENKASASNMKKASPSNLAKNLLTALEKKIFKKAAESDGTWIDMNSEEQAVPVIARLYRMPLKEAFDSFEAETEAGTVKVFTHKGAIPMGGTFEANVIAKPEAGEEGNAYTRAMEALANESVTPDGAMFFDMKFRDVLGRSFKPKDGEVVNITLTTSGISETADESTLAVYRLEEKNEEIKNVYTAAVAEDFDGSIYKEVLEPNFDPNNDEDDEDEDDYLVDEEVGIGLARLLDNGDLEAAFGTSKMGPAVVTWMESVPVEREFKAAGDDWEVEIHTDGNDGLPEAAELRVNEILPGDDGYDAYLAAAEARMQEEDKTFAIGDARFFDISFLAGGKKIEPQAEVDVTIRASLKSENEDASYSVLHFAEDAEEVEAEETQAVAETEAAPLLRAPKKALKKAAPKKAFTVEAPELMKADFARNGKKGEMHFKSDRFSVYAVVGEGNTGDYGRMTVEFYNDETKIASMIVKNSDTEEELEVILFDPGAGNMESGELFKGWIMGDPENEYAKPDYTTEDVDQAMTIEDIRQWAAARTISEGETVKFYAMKFKTFAVTFKDEDGSTVHSEALITGGNEVSYLVNQEYTPKSEDAKFEGWYWEPLEAGNNARVTTEAGVEIAQSTPITNGTTVKISGGSVCFRPNPAEGYWLSFMENGKGASYTPPQFIKQNDVTVRPADPTRLGYTFGGWYTNEECTGSQFTFGNTITSRTTLYAKWNPVQTAPYTVLIWQQQTEGDKYDFVQSIHLTGPSKTNVNSISQRGSGNDTYARISGTDYQYEGFHLKEFDQNVEIEPEGTSVVNVYYDRNEYTLTFRGLPRETTTQNGWHSVYAFNSRRENLQETWLYYYNGDWYTQQGDLYSGGVYSSNNFTNVKTITARYGADISANFPIVGNNGVTYNQGERWQPGDNDLGWEKVMVSIQTMPHDDVVFTLNSPNRPLKTMNYYVEALPTDTGTVTAPTTLYIGNRNTRVYPGSTRFKLDMTLNARYNGVTVEDLLDLDGFTLYGVDSQMSDSGFYIYDDSRNGTVNIYYLRDKYKIVYNDGKYVNGDGVEITTETKRTAMHESGDIYYQASLSDQKDEYNPTVAGYSFDGWYLDDACTQPFDFDETTMPKGGVQLYAKWVQIQYRVFLHPNVPTSDTLEWGQQDQQTSFRVNYGDKVSGGHKIIGERDGGNYEIIGWYTDPECTKTFNFDAYTLRDDTVDVSGDPLLSDYAKTENTELDKYGNPTETGNKDAAQNRTWITKKLDLYAKWRSVIVGAPGINIEYDAVLDQGQFPGGSTIYTDPLTYYLDKAESTAAAASNAISEDKQFLHWVVQRWDSTQNKYVDVPEKTVYPGDAFEVLKEYAKEEDYEGEDASETHYKKYTVRLRAEYGDKEAPTPTHITWYDNFTENPVEGTNYVTDNNLQINEAVNIEPANKFTREGYTFLGWARVPTTNTDGTPIAGYTLTPQDLDENDLYLKYEDGKFKVKDGAAWKEVTQVAADEKHPYHDMYAVWDREYKVKVKKIVEAAAEDISADKKFNFTVAVDDGCAFTIDGVGSKTTFELAHNGEAVIGGLKKNTTVTVTETADTGYVTSYKIGDGSATSGAAASYKVVEEDYPEVTSVKDITFTNKKLYKATISKKVEGTDSHTEDGYTFTVTRSDVTGDPETYQIKNNGSQVVAGIPYGATITVAETPDANYQTTYKVDDGEAVAEVSTGAVEVKKDTTVEFTNKRLYKVTVKKVVQADDTSKGNDSFGFTFHNENGAAAQIFDLKDNGIKEITGIPHGTTVTVTEGDAENYSTVYAINSGNAADGKTASVESVEADTEIVFTNTKLYNVNISKTVVGDDEHTDDGYNFTVTVAGDATPKTTAVKNGETKTISGIPYNAVITVAENEYTGYKTEYKVGSAETAAEGRTTDSITVTGDVNVAFTNTKLYTLTLTKKVVGIDSHTEDGYAFTLTGVEGVTAKDGTGNPIANPASITLKNNDTVTISQIPAGRAITITEGEYAEYNTTYKVDTESAVDGRECAVTVNADKAVEFTNTRKSHQVSFIKVDETGKELPGATFNLIGTDGSVSIEGLVSDAEGYLAKEGQTAFELVVPEAGKTYKLVETIPPTGYYPVEGEIVITVEAGGASMTIGGTPVQRETPSEAEPNLYTFKVSNTKGVSLPSTGGRGAKPFTLFGIMFILAGAFGLSLRRRFIS